MEGRYPNARRSSVAVCIILLEIVKVNIMIPRSSWTILGSFLALCIGTFAMAEDLQVLTGPAILTISGDIEQRCLPQHLKQARSGPMMFIVLQVFPCKLWLLKWA
jgi:hypothetical protein